jgi:hypothetical protein
VVVVVVLLRAEALMPVDVAADADVDVVRILPWLMNRWPENMKLS